MKMLLAGAFLSVLALGACNTVQGAGEDISGAGQAITGTAQDAENEM